VTNNLIQFANDGTAKLMQFYLDFIFPHV